MTTDLPKPKSLPKGYRLTSISPRMNTDRNGRTGYGPGKIFLQCSSDLYGNQEVCPNEIYIVATGSYSTDDLADEVARRVFEDCGWSISPTMCPTCVAKYKKPVKSPENEQSMKLVKDEFNLEHYALIYWILVHNESMNFHSLKVSIGDQIPEDKIANMITRMMGRNQIEFGTKGELIAVPHEKWRLT